MYHRTISEFFDHEISEMHKNIDRINRDLAGQDPDDERLTGQFALLDEQKRHLHFIEQLRENATSYEEAIAICREYIIANEQAHSAVAARENEFTALHSQDWWRTLHDAQFVSDVMHRIQSWQQTYAR